MRAGKSSPRNEQALQSANQSGGVVTAHYLKDDGGFESEEGQSWREELLRFDTDPPDLVQTLRQLEAVPRSFPAKQAQ